MSRRIGFPLGIILGVLAVLPAALLASVAPEAALRVNVAARFQPPGTAAWLGTDHLGRDLATRLAYGTGLSLRAAALSIVLALVLALVLGTLAGARPRSIVSRAIDGAASLLFVVPFFLLAVAAAAVLEPGLETIYLIVGLVIWPAPARLVRAEVAQLQRARFVLAERAFGLPPLQLFVRTYVPLTLLPPLVALALLLPELLAVDVGLSFFGLGAQPSTPTLGRLVFQGLMDARRAWWAALFPLMTLFGLCFILNAATQALARRMLRLEEGAGAAEVGRV